MTETTALVTVAKENTQGQKKAEVTDFKAFAKEMEKRNNTNPNPFHVGDFVIGKPNNGYTYLTERTYCVVASINKIDDSMDLRALASTQFNVVDKIYTGYPSHFNFAPDFSEWRKELGHMYIGGRVSIWIPKYVPQRNDTVYALPSSVTGGATYKNKSTTTTTYPNSTYTAGRYTTYTPAPAYKGKKNKTAFPEFINLCKLNEKKLKQYLSGQMKKIFGEEKTYIDDGYIFCEGDIPVMLTAHMDTVHKQTVRDFYEDVKTDKKGNTTHTIASPQGIGGDDRCGVYAIMKILEAGLRPYVLFCEQEEVGGKGSAKFCAREEMVKKCLNLKFMIEIDRANSKDLVFYDNDNDEWIKWITEVTGWKKAWGSFSDISHLSPAIGVSSVNMSCGYYKAHTVNEYVIMEELLHTIEKIKLVLTESEKAKQFEYIERKSYYGYGRGFYGNGIYGGGYDWDGDDWDGYGYTKTYGNSQGSRTQTYSTTKGGRRNGTVNTNKKEDRWILEIDFYNPTTQSEEQEIVKGETEYECWYKFFLSHKYVSYSDILDSNSYNYL